MNIMKSNKRNKNRFSSLFGRNGSIIALALAAFMFTSCDLGVQNPGQIDDADLDTPAAVTPLVNGVKGDFGYATTIPGGGGLYTVSGVLTDELVHVGSWIPIRLASFGISINSEPENQSRWGYAQRARWVAEDAIRRISNIVDNPQNNSDVGMVTLYAGFSNRVMGDTFCEAVIDGGPLEPHTRFSERAVEFFTSAITIAQNVGNAEMLNAAYGGRAQAHMMLGNWNEALADADNVPTDFVFNQVHSDNAGREHNGVHNWTTRGDNGDQMSVWGTPFAEWGTDLSGENDTENDPRVRYEVQLDGEGNMITNQLNRPLWYSFKFESRNSPIPIVKGTEMRLIEAEAALVQNDDVTAAVNLINEVRDHHGLDPHDPAEYDLDGAWELLMKEKGIELWLEGRRIADLRRWADTPGMVPFEVVREDNDNPLPVLEVEAMCLEVSSDEINSNPNI
jgi:starch-binding outer membrane protein, SusD/RagB family